MTVLPRCRGLTHNFRMLQLFLHSQHVAALGFVIRRSLTPAMDSGAMKEGFDSQRRKRPPTCPSLWLQQATDRLDEGRERALRRLSGEAASSSSTRPLVLDVGAVETAADEVEALRLAATTTCFAPWKHSFFVRGRPITVLQCSHF